MMKSAPRHLLSLVTILFLFSGCAQQAPAPGNPIDGDNSNSQGIEDGSLRVDPNGGDESETGQTSGSGLTDSERAECMTNCEAACDIERHECDAEANSETELGACGTDQTQCYIDCDSRPWDEGGCNDVIFDNGSDDERIIPPGTTPKSISLRHCTQKEDALAINNGVLGFVTQRGVLKVERGKYSGGYEPPYNWHHQNHFTFAAAGMAGWNTRGTKGHAIVTIDGTEHIWPFPGAIAFDLKSKIDDLDASRPTFFVRERVIRHGERRDQESKSAHWYIYNDYWGTNYHQDLMLYKNGFKWKNVRGGGHRDLWEFTNCDFTTEFKLYYYPK